MTKLRVLHVIPSLSPQDGGPSAAMPLMARALAGAGCTVTVATTAESGAVEAPQGNTGDPVEGPGGTYHFFARQTRFYKFSWPLARWLGEHAGEFDVIHLHALFTFSSGAAAWSARRTGVPYVVRPLGVLNRWGMENRRRWLKQWSLHWVDLPILRGASAIHYTTQAERAEASLSNLRVAAVPSAVIPLAIDFPTDIARPDPNVFLEQFPQLKGRKVILFLSRLDAKKGLELLLDAFARLLPLHHDTSLVIAGGGDPGYVNSLHSRADALGIRPQLCWTGFLGGEVKRAAFVAATVFALPSHSENFGIAAAEALATGVPAVLSDGVALAAQAAAAGAAVAVPGEVTPLAEALARLLDDPVERMRLSAAAREYAARMFSLDAVGARLVRLYRSILEDQPLEP